MKINLDLAKAVTVKEAVVKTVSSVNLHSIKDDGNNRTVVATILIDNDIKKLILWEGDVYDSIGDWTQVQAEDRIKELL